MSQETVVSSRWDREIRKKIITPGNYDVVPFEDSRCKVVISEVNCKDDYGTCEIDPGSGVFSSRFSGNVLIGDSDNFIDKDFDLLLQQMCEGETCSATFVYKNSKGRLSQLISCTVELVEVTEEQVISDWSWQRLLESANHHKEKGVELVKANRIVDGFRRFSKSLKFLVAIEPVDPKEIDENSMSSMKDLKIKLYNNLAHCQLQFNEYEAVLELCARAMQLDPANTKALYRRSLAYSGLSLNEEAWKDIQEILKVCPNDKAALQRAAALKPLIEKMKKDYNSVIKNMFRT